MVRPAGYIFAPRDVPMHAELTAIVRAIAVKDGGDLSVDDRDVDRLFPKDILKLSRIHWTPVAVALRAARWLAPTPAARVLDVGSGAGKFCLVGALATGAQFTGIELHGDLVKLAQDLARRHRVAGTRFITGDGTALDWTPFSGIYLYNPFSEAPEPEFVTLVARVHAKLAAAPSGTRAAVLCGYGGERPAGYRIVDADVIGAGQLELWEKA